MHAYIHLFSQLVSQSVSHWISHSVGHLVSESFSQSFSQSVSQSVSHSVSHAVADDHSCSLTIHRPILWCNVIRGDCARIGYFIYCFSQLAGVHPRQVHTHPDGTLDLFDIENKVRSQGDAHAPISRLICIEQTHNGTGGQVLSLDYLQKVILLHLILALQEDWLTYLSIPSMYSYRKYGSILPPREYRFCFAPPLPAGYSGLLLYTTSKNLAFKTPLPLGISNDLPWGGYGLFLELHNTHSLTGSLVFLHAQKLLTLHENNL